MSRPRKVYQGMVLSNGGTSSSSVTKNLSYLVCNEDQGSTKSRMAREYGVKVITEQEFLTMIGEDIQNDDPKIVSYSLFEG